MATEFEIVVKEGWKLNDDRIKVNGIIRAVGDNDGHCPTKIEKRLGHDQCPCCDYLEHNICYCGLYVKQAKINKDENKRANTADVPYSC